MKIPILIEFLRLLNKLMGRDREHIPVPDLRSIREEEAAREVRILRLQDEQDRLQAERAKRLDENRQGQVHGRPDAS